MTKLSRLLGDTEGVAKDPDNIECDVLVVGSGATGLLAAVTAKLNGLDVQVVEKEFFVGGCSAYSFGMLWMPCNPVANRSAVPDSRVAALTYLRSEMGESFDQASLETYLDNGPRMVEFLERRCGLRFEIRKDFPDYSSETPGASQHGRTILPAPFDARTLGKELHRLRPLRMPLFGMSLTPTEIWLIASRSFAGLWYLSRRLARHWFDLLFHGRSTRIAGGAALVASLFKTAKDLGVPIHTQTSATELLREDGRVSGAVLESQGRKRRLYARRGVVLACGGFGHDLARCTEWFGRPSPDGRSWSLAPTACNGDGLRLGMAAGVSVETELSNAGFWVPVSRLPDEAGSLSIHSHDRAQPGFFAVTLEGRRFVNEAESNHHFCEAMIAAAPPGQAPQAWLVCDHRALATVGLGETIRGWPFPIGKYLRSGYLLKSDSIKGLAAEMRVDVAAFEQTVERLNGMARTGIDADFHKGETRSNRAMSLGKHKPNPCLRSLDKGPFYAVKICVGHMATLAGLRTDSEGRALNAANQPVPGLYVTGNDRVNTFRGACPGGGITLGPGLTAAYLTGLSLAKPEIAPEIRPCPMSSPTTEVVMRDRTSADSGSRVPVMQITIASELHGHLSTVE